MFSQSQKVFSSNLIIETKAHYGFLIPHHVEMQIFNSHFMAYEVSISKATFGRTRWEYMYNYPVIGISLWYSTLGNSEYFGSGTALFPYINFPLFTTHRATVSFRLGFGLGYIEKPFHRIENYKNIAIGSHLNAAANFMLEYRYKMNDRLIITGGMGFVHFSNGATKTPNYGVNIPSANLGLAFRLSKENKYLRKKLLPELFPFEFDGKKYFNIDMAVGMGVKDMKSEFDKTFYVYAACVNVFKQISFTSKVGLGFNFSYDGTDRFVYEKNNNEAVHDLQFIRPGFHLGYELLLSRVSFVFQLGAYLGGKEKSDGGIYEKLGVKFHFSNNWFTHVTLKAHAGRADFITYGLGYSINIKYY